MDLKEIKRLLEMLVKYRVQEADIEEEGKRLHFRFPDSPQEGNAPGFGAPPDLASSQVVPGGGGKSDAPRAPQGTVIFTSPMVGTYYRSPSPGSDPFLRKSAKIKEGNTLCIIEAMKVMNEIKAEMEVEVVDILVKNEEPVEYGQPLLILKPL